ncbi:uncharacterized protein LOC125797840 [Astyanax mexicanus]|uniref:uncharacterized protein LOC125788716 n=1 Tax=Astyanax mexicanus TaxID=7994 RepID=UPI0020CB2D83|nr:uncharacterized protein LOC125788716 [Astyanax mexicanus]XP_049329221.1 uncharacterized protein LOC125790783 [Astyanax mexicanus]XP_049330055.1 uncharacterized protein LOC125797567 [Astyanax mexicanus]XP_049330071.1 uncharacterized protein LOC125797840 [Astyanax mexicanus]
MMSKQSVQVRGFSGTSTSLPKTKPLQVHNDIQTVLHSFLIAPQAPLNICGRDLLMKMGVSILCSPDGLTLTWLSGQQRIRLSGYTEGMYLLQTGQDETVDIYWGLLNDDQPHTPQTLELFQQWAPWIRALAPYAPPADPYHVTLFYDVGGDITYYDTFQSELQDTQWEVQTNGLYCGPEGVAAPVTLTPQQYSWYKMDETAAPHMSLALHPKHEAKQLGPMVKRANAATDWVQTQIPDVMFSISTNTYHIRATNIETVTMEHQLLPRHHGCEDSDHPDSIAMLESLPDVLWSQGPDDVGFVDQPQVSFNMATPEPIWVPQYRHKPEAMASLDKTIQALLQAGVLEQCQSDWNTPILPVPKKEPGQYRMAHDLRAINAALATSTIPVPNPYTTLSELGPDMKWFTCIDLANAFFCVPLAEHCRDVCAFTHRGIQYRYSRLPQGFALSPGLFNQALRRSLDSCNLPEGSILSQYVDDLLVGGTTPETCLNATKAVLECLANAGYKVSRSKLQCCRTRVTFLGRVVTQGSTGMSASHRSTILSHTKPITVRDMLTFLGLAGYSRQYIPDFVGQTQPLRDMVKSLGMRNLSGVLSWTVEAEQAFIAVKQALATAADLSRPDYSLPFFLDVSETDTLVNGVLFQKKEEGRAVLMYLSIPLDLIEKRQPQCTRHVAGLTKLVQKTAHLVAGYPLHILTTHGVVAYINSQMFTLTPLRQRRIHKVLTAPHITYTHQGVNMAEGMLEGPPHECAEKVATQEKVRPDLLATPIPGSWNLWTDGCGYRADTGEIRAGYAVVQETTGETDEFWTVAAKEVKQNPSAQKAELLAVIAALELAEGREVTIYSDSAWVVSAAHVDIPHWKPAGYVTSSGKPVKHQSELMKLEAAIHKPTKVAIVKCKGHQKGDTLVSRGNDAADKAAKKAAGYTEPGNMMILDSNVPWEPIPTGDELRQIQDKATPEEKSMWLAKGASSDSQVWVSKTGRPVLPMSLARAVLEEAHTVAHVGKLQMMRNLKQWWHPFMLPLAVDFISQCQVCHTQNVAKAFKVAPGKFPLPSCHGEHIQIDYTDMIDQIRKYRYLLVVVDRYSGWVEAIPTFKEDARSVCKMLINHWIPQHGFPRRVHSDNGSHFTSKTLQWVEQALGLRHSYGSVYHPASQGQVERMNQNLKAKLAKIKLTTGMNWLDALPIALISIRSSVNRSTGFSPFELVRGVAFPGPQTALKAPSELPHGTANQGYECTEHTGADPRGGQPPRVGHNSVGIPESHKAEVVGTQVDRPIPGGGEDKPRSPAGRQRHLLVSSLPVSAC